MGIFEDTKALIEEADEACKAGRYIYSKKKLGVAIRGLDDFGKARATDVNYFNGMNLYRTKGREIHDRIDRATHPEWYKD